MKWGSTKQNKLIQKYFAFHDFQRKNSSFETLAPYNWEQQTW